MNLLVLGQLVLEPVAAVNMLLKNNPELHGPTSQLPLTAMQVVIKRIVVMTDGDG